uniref:Uncharacterized protein n=1 Tax=Brassica oleracea TaxID=3712 RepID=A0A3P6DHN9_BRAOL|nr:unnamed protein product [Brassica oleracea]
MINKFLFLLPVAFMAVFGTAQTLPSQPILDRTQQSVCYSQLYPRNYPIVSKRRNRDC